MTNSLDALAQGNEEFDDEDDDEDDEDTTDTEDLEDGKRGGQSPMTSTLKFLLGGYPKSRWIGSLEHIWQMYFKACCVNLVCA